MQLTEQQVNYVLCPGEVQHTFPDDYRFATSDGALTVVDGAGSMAMILAPTQWTLAVAKGARLESRQGE